MMGVHPATYPSSLDSVAARLLELEERLREDVSKMPDPRHVELYRRHWRRLIGKRRREDFLRTVCALDRDLLLKGWAGPPADVLERIVESQGLTIIDGPITNPGHQRSMGLINIGESTVKLHVTAERCSLGTNIPGLRNAVLAHELGHWRLHRENIMTLPPGRREHQAFVYAEEFLLPEEMLDAHPVVQALREPREAPPEEQLWADLAKVAADFRVTRSLVVKRLVGLCVLQREGRRIRSVWSKVRRPPPDDDFDAHQLGEVADADLPL